MCSRRDFVSHRLHVQCLSNVQLNMSCSNCGSPLKSELESLADFCRMCTMNVSVPGVTAAHSFFQSGRIDMSYTVTERLKAQTWTRNIRKTQGWLENPCQNIMTKLRRGENAGTAENAGE